MVRFIHIPIFSDSLLHYLWNTRLNSSWKSIQELIDLIHVTQRTTWNTNLDTIPVIKYLSWTLNININIFSMRETRTHQNKYTFQYIFQNTLLKLLRPISNFPSIHILYHDKHYFVLNKPDVFPTLINLPAVSCITFNNVKVTLDHIYQILNNSSTLSFPFTIKLFTSYSYIKSTSKQMHNNMIGQYLNSHQKECLYIFITPCLARNNMFLHRLQELNNLTFNRTNLFTNSRHREGKQTNYTSLPLPKITNQKYCICQHEETQEITLPRKYNHIGM